MYNKLLKPRELFRITLYYSVNNQSYVLRERERERDMQSECPGEIGTMIWR